MSRTRLPFAPGAAREALAADPELTTLVPVHLITTRDVPATIDRPFITVRSTTAARGADPMLRTPWVQVDVWVPERGILQSGPAQINADPEEVAWDLAGLCGEILGRVRKRQFRSASWNGDWVDGPGGGPGVDTSRSIDFPIFRASVRVQMTMQLQEEPRFYWAAP